MKSVGEVMSIGRTFKESLQKAICSLEIQRRGLSSILSPFELDPQTEMETRLKKPSADRLWHIADAFRHRFDLEKIHHLTQIDPWFLNQIQELISVEREIEANPMLTKDLLQRAKKMGFSDHRLAYLTQQDETEVRKRRSQWNLHPTFKTVDTCAAEFEAHTPYYYSTYDEENENGAAQEMNSGTRRIGEHRQASNHISEAALHFEPPRYDSRPNDIQRSNIPKKKIMILGGGPNRIGQGIEFDYCCVHASLGLKEEGFETIMVNCNPETVSTDYDISDKLYFEPLTLERVLAICEREKPNGVIVQFGGQTPLKLALSLEKEGVPILGTSPQAIHRAEDREEFGKLMESLKLKTPPYGIARTLEEAKNIASRLGYPVLIRPSYVLGGRAMEIVYDEPSLKEFARKALEISEREHPILIDKFLKEAKEIDVDVICDGKDVLIGAIMEHIEEAGIHSGDSTCSLPPYTLSPAQLDVLRDQSKKCALALGVRGLMNVQFAIQNGDTYILEINPRASRTVPFASKATGLPLAKIAARVMAGKTLQELGYTKEVIPKKVSVKEVVFPFIRFPGCDVLLGPEMRSTGEVMGSADSFALAFAKAYLATGCQLPLTGKAFLSVRDEDKSALIPLAKKLSDFGFKLIATHGTHHFLKTNGMITERINKVLEGHPHCVDALKNNEIQLVINTTFGKKEVKDSFDIRRTALLKNIPYFTVLSAARVAIDAIEALGQNQLDVEALQDDLP